MRSTNNQIQADMYADEGFVVVMPDLFGGDVAPNTATSVLDPNNLDGSREGNDPSAPLVDSSSSSSLLGLFKIKAVETVKSFMIDMWLARHTEAKVLPILHRVLDASRAEFADAVSSGDGVYAVGYCFGGRYVLLLSRMPENTGGQESAATSSGSGADVDLEAGTAPPPKQNRPLIKVGALAHATLVSPDDFTGLQAPISMVCVESDPMFPDEVRTVGEDYLSKHNVEHEVQVYPGVPHGEFLFFCRPPPAPPSQISAESRLTSCKALRCMANTQTKTSGRPRRRRLSRWSSGCMRISKAGIFEL